MIAKFNRRMRALAKSTSGNATMMTLFAMPALIGATGYGVDTAQWYMMQRELQHAVDQGAIAGAWSLAYKDTGSSYQNRATREFNANLQVTNGKAATPDIQLASYSGGTDNSVVVSSYVDVELPFTGMLMNRTSRIYAKAQAAYKEGTDHKACLRTLKKNASGTFTIGNGATVIANCGVMAISCEPGAVQFDQNATIDINTLTVCNQDAADVSSNFTGNLVVDQSIGNYTNDLFAPPVPDDEPSKTYACSNGNPKQANPTPGLYADGIVVKCNTTFASGIYYVKGTLDLTANAVVAGYKVMFVLLDGASLKLGGSGANGTGNDTNVKSSLNLTPMQSSDLLAAGYDSDFASKYENMLIISDNSDIETSNIINGNANTHIQGKIHLPKGDMTVNGAAQAADGLCFQITSYTIKVSGGAYLQTLCDDSETNSINSIPGVRLVA
ncbi:pilus assembly protein TadG-related protein [Tsuneonella mangrovi]|uniref:pilus assembly protein TadG-related protein n=1 Tax=Tsuneonella mangrovi TaxID=1982042 RepID=UPI000BA1F9AF|nr:TadE/TadG family type IV pilus assembly protein [Tsuneonella mangrovi]